jgi:hypothetical protein
MKATKHVYFADQGNSLFIISALTILNSPTGWGQLYRWVETFDQPTADYQIELISNADIISKFGEKFDGLSAASIGTTKTQNTAYINISRWAHGSAESRLTLRQYRKYVINHEVGHLLGLHHPDLSANNTNSNKCPNMAVQTDGMCDKSYRENVEPLPYEIELVKKFQTKQAFAISHISKSPNIPLGKKTLLYSGCMVILILLILLIALITRLVWPEYNQDSQARVAPSALASTF